MAANVIEHKSFPYRFRYGNMVLMVKYHLLRKKKEKKKKEPGKIKYSDVVYPILGHLFRLNYRLLILKIFTSSTERVGLFPEKLHGTTILVKKVMIVCLILLEVPFTDYLW